MTSRDLDDVLVVEHLSFTLPWSKRMFEDELSNPQAHYLVLELGEHVIGYGGFWKILDEGHITNIAVHRDFRGKSYGKKLLKALLEHARNLGIHALTLEVRVSNAAAIALYEGFGFEKAGVRKRYYADNQEDALIMWLQLH
jgi:ribosomal-protein-alanine N-acetyltransferase